MFTRKFSLSWLILLVSLAITRPSLGQMAVEVKPGNTLWSIAQEYLGCGELWPVLAEHNQFKAPYSIYPGDKIKIPADYEKKAAKAKALTLSLQPPGPPVLALPEEVAPLAEVAPPAAVPGTVADHLKELKVSLISEPPIYNHDGINFAAEKCTFRLVPARTEDHIVRIMVDVDEQGYRVYPQPISFEKPGTHSLRYYAVNLLGYKGESERFNLVIEASHPEVAIVSEGLTELEGETFALKDGNFSLFAKDEGMGVERIVYALNSQEFQEYQGPFAISQLPDGRHRIRFKAQDLVGNWSEEKEFWVRTDRMPPDLDINFSKIQKEKRFSGQPVPTSGLLLAISAQDPSGIAKLLVEVDGGGFMEYQEPLVVDGKRSHKFRCRAEDRLGNSQEKEFRLESRYLWKLIFLLLAGAGCTLL